MPAIQLIDHDAVLAAVSARDAIDRVRDGFAAFATGAWAMPAKVYLPAPPNGDFRAMPARGAGLAIVKWVTSFPGNPTRGLPTVTGLIVVSDAESGEPLALVDGRAVTALRTGAVAAVATAAIRGGEPRSVGVVGCGLHGSWAARCMAAAGHGPGTCFDTHEQSAAALADELGWAVGGREDAVAADVICAVTPGSKPVIESGELHAGQHVNALGADGPGKSEVALDELLRCRLYCDEWEQAAHGGELTIAAQRGQITRDDVTELGALIAGTAELPPTEAISLFDSTGLAIQDLAICVELIEQLRAGRIDAPEVEL